VSNHASWLDPYMIARMMNVGFKAKKSCETTPLIAPIVRGLNGCFISRGADEAGRIQKVKDVETR